MVIQYEGGTGNFQLIKKEVTQGYPIRDDRIWPQNNPPNQGAPISTPIGYPTIEFWRHWIREYICKHPAFHGGTSVERPAPWILPRANQEDIDNI